eukprot:UN01427
MKIANRPNHNKKSIAKKASPKQHTKKSLHKTKKLNKNTLLAQKRNITNNSQQPSSHDINEYLRQRASQLLKADPVIQSLLSQQQQNTTNNNNNNNNNTSSQQSKATSTNDQVTDKSIPQQEQTLSNNNKQQQQHVNNNKEKRKQRHIDPFQQLIAALDGNHKDMLMSSDNEDDHHDWLFDNFFRSDPFFNPHLHNALNIPSSPLLSSSSPRSIFAAQHPLLTPSFSKQRWKKAQQDYDNMMKNFLKHRIHPMSALHGVDLLGDNNSSEDISSSDYDEPDIQEQQKQQQQQQQPTTTTSSNQTPQKPIATLDNLPKDDLDLLKQQLKQRYNNNIDELLNDFFNTATLNQIFPTIKQQQDKQQNDNNEKQQEQQPQSQNQDNMKVQDTNNDVSYNKYY